MRRCFGVYELPPAHTLTWHDGRLTTRRYAAPRFLERRGRSLGAWAEKIGQTLAESADAHRIADVAVGFLSGGVDSSLVTRETARSQPNVQCFSVGYAEGKLTPSCPLPAPPPGHWAYP